MAQYSPVFAHGNINEIFPNIFIVTGANQTHYAGTDLQHSRNMIIIREDDKISLINTVRLDDQGLSALDALGKVTHVIRIGAFHGRDDAFYLDRYHAKLWALPKMTHEANKKTDIELIPNGPIPFKGAHFFQFESSVYPEGIIYLNQHDGILITCDSVKNWVSPDAFFSPDTATLYKEQGFFGCATISPIWRQACKVTISDFTRLQLLSYRHLISAHGEPLLNDAHEHLSTTLKTTIW